MGDLPYDDKRTCSYSQKRAGKQRSMPADSISPAAQASFVISLAVPEHRPGSFIGWQPCSQRWTLCLAWKIDEDWKGVRRRSKPQIGPFETWEVMGLI